MLTVTSHTTESLVALKLSPDGTQHSERHFVSNYLLQVAVNMTWGLFRG